MTVGFGSASPSVTEYAYDCGGRLDSVWAPDNPSQGQSTTPSSIYTYDEFDRMTSVLNPWGGPSGPALVSTSYGYDVQDHLTSVTDAEGNVTSYVYSDRDLLTSETSPVAGTTTHAYGDHGSLRRTVDARAVQTDRTTDERPSRSSKVPDPHQTNKI